MVFQKYHSSVTTRKSNDFVKSLKIFFEKYFFTPYVFQSIEAKPFVATKKDSVQSLHSEKK